MTYHYFTSKEDLDLAFLTTFGLSVKVGENPIGQFGTGLKYAIAVILRGGGSCSIVNSDQRLDLHAKREVVRGKEVERIYANDLPLPFTTELGKNWEPWMAFRELLSNSWDEGGGWTQDLPPSPPYISVSWSAFDSVAASFSDYFRPSRPDRILAASKEMEVTAGSGLIFLQGIRVGQIPGGCLDYYLNPSPWRHFLTEDRVLSGTYVVQKELEACLTIEAAREINKHDGTDLLPSFRLSDYLAEPLMQLRQAKILRHPILLSALERWEREQPPATRPPNEAEMKVIDWALDILQKCSFPLPASYSISIAPEANFLGRVNLEEASIEISSEAFRLGRREVLKTLLEEFTHLRTGARDKSYEMHHALLDNWLDLASKHLNEIF